MLILLNCLFEETRVIVLYIGLTSTSIILVEFLVHRRSEFPAHSRYNELNIDSGRTLDCVGKRCKEYSGDNSKHWPRTFHTFSQTRRYFYRVLVSRDVPKMV